MTQPLKVIIVEDTELFRKGLKMVINKFEKTRVVGEASSGVEFMDLLLHVKPDVVLMDIMLPDTTGIKLTEETIKIYPDIKIIALTMFGEDEYISNMMKAGARGFLLKNIGKEELFKALHAVNEGRIFYSEELMSYFYKKVNSTKTELEIKLLLTKREIEILNHIAQGLTDNEISNVLNLSPRTVNGHRNNMLAKTSAKNTVNLIIFAIKNNIIEL